MLLVLLGLFGRLCVIKSNEIESTMNQSESKKKVAYLTFDDGPSNITREVLKVLKEKDVKATFFLIGNAIEGDMTDVVKQEILDGHVVGVHTYSHKKEDLYSSVESFMEDFDKTYKKIEEVTGVKPEIYRFPWGSVNCYVSNICDEIIKRMEERGFTYYDWNVSAEDSIGKPSKSSIFKNIRKDFKKFDEPVILMHDSSINKLTVEILPEIIDEIRAAGYEFGTLDNRSEPYQYRKN